METLSSQEKEAIIRLYKNTLPGAVIAYLKLHEEASEEELMKFVTENYAKFRNSTGCKYKGKKIQKVIQGLISHPVFMNRSGYFSINVCSTQPLLIEEYEKKRMDSIYIQRKKTRLKINFLPEARTNRTADIILMIENFCGQLSRDPDFFKIFDSPFKVKSIQKIKTGESYQDAGAKIGFERLIGMIQGFEITSRYCKE